MLIIKATCQSSKQRHFSQEINQAHHSILSIPANKIWSSQQYKIKTEMSSACLALKLSQIAVKLEQFVEIEYFLYSLSRMSEGAPIDFETAKSFSYYAMWYSATIEGQGISIQI